MTRRKRLAVVAAAVGLALTPVAIGSAQAAAPPPLPHAGPGAPPPLGTAAAQANPGQVPGSADAAQPDSAPAAVPDLPIQASDIALSFPNQPGTGVVLTDAAGKRRAIAAAGGAAAWAEQLAKADAALRDYNARKAAGTMPLPHVDSAPSGHRPYGGDMWSGGTVSASKESCSNGVSTRSSAGAQYEYTAGHCVRPDGVTDVISATTGVFCVGWVNPCPSIDIGNTGHGGTCVGYQPTTCGDRTFIRGSKIPVGNDGRREVRTWDSRVTVALNAARNPVYAESASVSGGMSGKLMYGQVVVPGQPVEFAPPTPVIYVGVMKSTTPVGAAGCPIPGDSGGTVTASNHDIIGVLTGDQVTSDGYCWIYFGRAGDALTAVNQVPAPLP